MHTDRPNLQQSPTRRRRGPGRPQAGVVAFVAVDRGGPSGRGAPAPSTVPPGRAAPPDGPTHATDRTDRTGGTDRTHRAGGAGPTARAYRTAGGDARRTESWFAPVRRWWHRGGPAWTARLVAVLGVLSLLSAVLPASRPRLAVVLEVLPASVPEAAAAASAAIGVLLLYLASGLRRRKRRAWLAATALAAAVAVLHLVKGLDVEEAAYALALFAVLVAGRREFTAVSDPRSPRRAVGVLAAAVATDVMAGLVLLGTRRSDVVGAPTLAAQLRHVLLGLVGLPGPVRFVDADATAQVAGILVALGGATLLLAAATALRSAAGPHLLAVDEERRLRGLLALHGTADSLGYFALRRDKSVAFSPSGKAAVSYRVVGGVSLASGDPLGDAEAWPGAIDVWLAEARAHAWVPAVLGAGERAATSYARAGLDALELGDEATVAVADFTLDGRAMRGVRQAVVRITRAGYTCTVDRIADLDPAAAAELRRQAAQWRDGSTERGFSMALGRLADPDDPAAVIVSARDGRGVLRGLLQLVPWGPDGLSLDVMRRPAGADNGVIELLVTTLLTAAPSLGVARVSLNFAVFRAVFERGERIGAGPVLRLWRRVLLLASRYWQLESLYRANAKYRPAWQPRFVCFATARDLPRIGVAALRAESFLVRPRWLPARRLRR